MPLAVAAAPAALPTDVFILDRSQFLGRYFSVADALQSVPFVNVERTGGRGTQALARIRGLAPSDVMILIDGQPVQSLFDGRTDLSQIPLSIVERIEITRGGAALAYGAEAVAGAINIVTSRPAAKGLDASIGTGVGRDGVKHHEGRVLWRTHRGGDLTYLTGQEVTGGFMNNEETNSDAHFANFSRSFNGAGFWGVDYFFDESEVGQPRGTDVPFEEWNGRSEQVATDPTAERQQDVQRARLLLASSETAAGRFTGSVAYGQRTLDDRSELTPASFRVERENRTLLYDASWRRRGLEAGIERREFRREDLNAPVRHAHQDGAYLTTRWEGRKWLVSESLRVDRHSEAGGFFSPRFVGLFTPGRDWIVSASASRSHRVPDFDELFSGVGANASLNPEEAASYDAGFAWSPGADFQMNVTWFSTRVKDVIAPEAGSGRLINQGRGKTNGVEASVYLRPLPGSRYGDVALFAGGTLQDSKRDADNDDRFDRAALTPRRLGVVRLEHRLPRKLTLTNELRFQDEMFEGDGESGVRVPSYYVWNLHFGLRILTSEVYFDVENVTRRRFADAVTASASGSTVLTPQPDRAFWAGLKIRFTN